jgi:peptidoglycan/LPS O-acetylase OafA/YrhL
MGDYFNRDFHQSVCPLNEQFRCGLPQTWTLIVEVTFYIALPLYALLTARMCRGRSPGNWMRAELAVLAILGGTSLLLGAEPFALHHETWFEFTFIGHMFWLSLGMGLAVVSAVYGLRRDRYPGPLRVLAARPGLCWAGAGAIYAFTVFAFYPAPFPVAPWTGFQYPALNLLQGFAAVLLMIPVLFGNPNRGAPARVLSSRFLLWVGAISYGLYLWQVTPSTDLGFGGAEQGFLVDLLGTIAISVPLAAASYYFLERPLMRLKGVPLRSSLASVVPAALRRRRA